MSARSEGEYDDECNQLHCCGLREPVGAAAS